MGDRRKRVKPADCVRVVDFQADQSVDLNFPRQICPRGGNQEVVSLAVNCTNFDAGSPASRSSVRHIYEVISNFDDNKKELVKSVGFDGLLEFPVIKQIHRKFSLWLMSSVDQRMSTLNIGDKISIGFNKYDVGHVFGIPSRGHIVLDDVAASREAKASVIQQFLGQEFNEKRSVKIVQDIIERQYTAPMSKQDADRFRVAFVVFVVSNLLCPSAKYDYASVDYWNALVVPDQICTYDWCGFVLTKLLDGVTKLKHDIANNIRYPSICGCAVFLQVLYLDSIELSGISMDHNRLPRISVFPYDIILKFILADPFYASHCGDESCRSEGKLRDPYRCIYSWAMQLRTDPVDTKTGGLLAIWESTIAMVHLLNIPLEAAGPLFVAAADFQDQIDGGQRVNGLVAVKFMSVLVSLMIPYSRGFRYQAPYASNRHRFDGCGGVNSALHNGIRLLSTPVIGTGKNPYGNIGGVPSSEVSCDPGGTVSDMFSGSCLSSRSSDFVQLHKGRIGDELQRSMQCAILRQYDTPDYLKVNVRVASAMSRFYDQLHRIRMSTEVDPNHVELCQSSGSKSPASCSAHSVEVLPSPWEVGYDWCFEDVDVCGFKKILHDIQGKPSLAIVHRDPKYIQVHYRDLCAQFDGLCEMDMDMFDALVRLARQQDDLLYASYGNFRWRHYFESDFMGVIMAGSVDLVDATLKEQLSLINVSYDLSKTEMVYFPAIMQCKWVVFVWQPSKNSISVFDPSVEIIDPAGRVELIERFCYMLKLALRTLSQDVFTGLQFDVMCAELYIIDVEDKCVDRRNHSGLICSMFYRCFNGERLCMKQDKFSLDLIAGKLFKEVPMLSGNSGLFSQTL